MRVILSKLFGDMKESGRRPWPWNSSISGM